ncbi:MAG: pyridoxamine 5'-phosphate oxidase family protein [Bacteroidales bacterium]|jgi:general stress protein 26|nr:pyridoxamine 5'-phosphate oxidase family protein [Bacteroidales bacterium]
MNTTALKIEQLIKNQSVSYISSVDSEGFPNTKAMLAPVKRDGIKTFFWHTNSGSLRVKQFRENPKACVYFCNPQSFVGAMLKGTMEVIDDPETKLAMWQDGFSMYYTGGALGGDFILLKFTATGGRVYGNFSSESFKVE